MILMVYNGFLWKNITVVTPVRGQSRLQNTQYEGRIIEPSI